jgi:hypothetical protein
VVLEKSPFEIVLVDNISEIIKKKGNKMMKKLINKWKNSNTYNEYCKNMAHMYNYGLVK